MYEDGTHPDDTSELIFRTIPESKRADDEQRSSVWSLAVAVAPLSSDESRESAEKYLIVSFFHHAPTESRRRQSKMMTLHRLFVISPVDF